MSIPHPHRTEWIRLSYWYRVYFLPRSLTPPHPVYPNLSCSKGKVVQGLSDPKEDQRPEAPVWVCWGILERGRTQTFLTAHLKQGRSRSLSFLILWQGGDLQIQLIRFKPRRFKFRCAAAMWLSCWTDRVLDCKNNDHLVDYAACWAPLEWSMGATVEHVIGPCKFYFQNALISLVPDIFEQKIRVQVRDDWKKR